MNVLTGEETAQGFRLLFNGKTLEGWAATKNEEGWFVRDGLLICRGERSGFLHTVEQFENFDLRLAYRTAARTNSGIFFRWSDLQDPVHTGFEMQILDTYGQETMQRSSSGALYDLVAPATNAVRPAGEWNEAGIRCEGSRIRLELNGSVVVDADIDEWTIAGQNPDGSPNKFKYAWRDMPRSGYIGLQDHGGYVEFRNIRLAVL